jgi:hypothetical protein
MLQPDVWQTAAGAPARLLRLCAPQGMTDLPALRAARGGLRHRRQPAGAAAPGLCAQHLQGIELLPERHGPGARRAAGAAAACGDASRAPTSPPASQDLVLQATVFSRCWTMPSSSSWPRRCGAGCAGRRRAVVRLHGRQPAQPRRARRAAGALRQLFPQGRVRARARHAGAAAGARACRRAPVGLHDALNDAAARGCAPTSWPGWPSPDMTTLPSCPSRCPRSATRRSPRSSTRCARAGSPPAPRPSASRPTFAAFLGDAVAALDRRQLGHRRPAPGAGRAGHRPGRRGHHHHPHLHRHRRGGALPGRRREAGRHRPGHAEHRPGAVEAAITPRTKAIMPVHYAGLAADMPAILAIARRHGLKVVEDAAHALPTTAARPTGRHLGQRRHGVQLLCQQDHHHRRRRHAGHARRGAGQRAR